jgi:hypothetical protein
VHEREHDLDGQVLARVVLADVEDPRLRKVVGGVVGDPHANQVAALVRRAEREDVDEARMGRGEVLHVGDHLGVVVVARVVGRKVIGRLRPHAVPPGAQGQRLRLRPVEHHVVGPGDLADVEALGDEIGALLPR